MTAIRRIPRRIPALLAWLALLAASGCQDDGALGPHSTSSVLPAGSARVVAAGLEMRLAFKGRVMSTQLSTDPNPPPGCQLFQHTILEGELTHLGRFSGTGTVCAFNVRAGVIDPPINPAGGPPPYLVADFVVDHTYTSASGEALHITGTGVRVQSLSDGSSGLMGVGTVAGGTGRFEGASGEFDVLGAFHVVRYDGWIIFDASSVPDD